MDERVQRVMKQEAALDAVNAQLAELQGALARWEAMRQTYKELLAYYESPLWLEDYDASNRGEFSEIPCGVLSQDAVYDTLTTQFAVAEDALRIAQAYLADRGDEEEEALFGDKDEA